MCCMCCVSVCAPVCVCLFVLCNTIFADLTADLICLCTSTTISLQSDLRNQIGTVCGCAHTQVPKSKLSTHKQLHMVLCVVCVDMYTAVWGGTHSNSHSGRRASISRILQLPHSKQGAAFLMQLSEVSNCTATSHSVKHYLTVLERESDRERERAKEPHPAELCMAVLHFDWTSGRLCGCCDCTATSPRMIELNGICQIQQPRFAFSVQCVHWVCPPL